jgi:hypothetical protein
VPGLTGVVQVAAGFGFSLALRSDGTVVAWGANGGGQLGDGSSTDRLTPVGVNGLTGVTQIAAGQDAAHRGQVPALLDGGGQQMHNRPDRGGTGRSGRRSATSASISWAHAVRHSARTLRIAGHRRAGRLRDLTGLGRLAAFRRAPLRQ